MGSTPDPPTVPASPPPAASPVDAAVMDARRNERRRLQAMASRASTQLSGSLGAQGSPTLGVPSLLGSA